MLTYKVGDVTKATLQELNTKAKKKVYMLYHIVNSAKIASSGIVVSIRDNLPGTIEDYELWGENSSHKCRFRKQTIPFELGEVQFSQFEKTTVVVCNAIGQKYPGRYKSLNGRNVPPIRLESVKETMIETADLARQFIKDGYEVNIVSGKFGSLRAGGDWDNDIVPLINEVWSDLDVVIYEYQEK